jgi:hypothetical protein
MADEKPEQDADRKPFAPRRRHTGGTKGAKKPPRVLKDMRQVYSKDESLDRTGGQKALRRMLNENPKEFLQQLARLEAAFLGKAAPAGGASAETPQSGASPGVGEQELGVRERLAEMLGGFQGESHEDDGSD